MTPRPTRVGLAAEQPPDLLLRFILLGVGGLEVLEDLPSLFGVDAERVDDVLGVGRALGNAIDLTSTLANL